jgi:hypothetical protein
MGSSNASYKVGSNNGSLIRLISLEWGPFYDLRSIAFDIKYSIYIFYLPYKLLISFSIALLFSSLRSEAKQF